MTKSNARLQRGGAVFHSKEAWLNMLSGKSYDEMAELLQADLLGYRHSSQDRETDAKNITAALEAFAELHSSTYAAPDKRETARLAVEAIDSDMAVQGPTDFYSLIEEVMVPGDLQPALAARRPELIGLAAPRALNTEECKVVYNLIRVLLETNVMLSDHSIHVGRAFSRWAKYLSDVTNDANDVLQRMKLIDGASRRLSNFANPEGR